MACDAYDHMVHAFPPFHSLDLLSLACSFCWPYNTKGIVKHGTLMYIMNTLQLEWSPRSCHIFCVCHHLMMLSFFLISLFSLIVTIYGKANHHADVHLLLHFNTDIPSLFRNFLP